MGGRGDFMVWCVPSLTHLNNVEYTKEKIMLSIKIENQKKYNRSDNDRQK